MTRTLTVTLAATALAAALAGPAFASDSLARSVGVEPGQFTNAQLVALKSAHADDDHSRIRQIMAEAQAGGFSGAIDFGQVSAAIGAEGLSPAQTVALKAAQDEDDHDAIFRLRNGGAVESGARVSTRGAVAPAQLSASVGVEPGTLTTAELVRLKAAQAEDDHDTIHRILGAVR
jgi:hypothetical protein